MLFRYGQLVNDKLSTNKFNHMNKRRVKRISVLQTSLVAAIVLLFVSLIFVIPFGLVMALVSSFDSSSFVIWSIPLIFVVPIFYGAFGFISTAIVCLVYNLVAKWTGGIEIEIELEGEK